MHLELIIKSENTDKTRLGKQRTGPGAMSCLRGLDGGFHAGAFFYSPLKYSFMKPNEKVNRLPETPTPELANLAYSKLHKLLYYAPAAQWRAWIEHTIEILAGDNDWAESDDNERAASVSGYLKLIHALEELEKANA